MSRVSLKATREAFGCTQEAVAAALGKSVTTVARWERNDASKGVKLNLPNRRLAYVLALMDQEFLQTVKQATTMEALFHGPDLMVLTPSAGLLQHYPLTRGAVGISLFNLTLSQTRKTLHAHRAQMEQGVENGFGTFHWTAPLDHKNYRGGLITRGMNIHGNFLPGGIVHMDATHLMDQQCAPEMVFY